ncbi:MAG TPA: hypothetical protein VJS42_00605 [Steroidobacteraceae bacterium]|nr:hypothetical protein [Steroidobacteraceae bacterium]
MRHPDPSRVAVFICSSDSRRDVLVRVLPSLHKFWPDCPYPIYVGLNSYDSTLRGGTHVLAPASEWHRECALQLAQLEEEYVIVILDDFLVLAPVDQARVADLVEDAVTLSLSYLRLLPLGRSLPARLSGWRLPELKPGIQRIPVHRPFYSGLQIAIWRKQHLQAMLEQPLTIWEFEHQYIPGSVHCALTDSPPIVYRHLVERGRWLPDAHSLLRRAGLPAELGERPVWPKSRYARLCLDQVRWLVFGYSTC